MSWWQCPECGESFNLSDEERDARDDVQMCAVCEAELGLDDAPTTGIADLIKGD